MSNKTTKQTATVTPIEQLKAAMEPELVELPGFAPGAPVVFRLRRASLRGMTKAGKIPNPLLGAAQRLYEGAGSTAKTNFGDMIKVMELVVASSMVEPTMKQLNSAEIELTEEQFGMIWAYSQKGVSALAAFRGQPGNLIADQDGQGVESAAQ